MQKIVLHIFLLFSISKIVGQEKKQIKQLDSIQLQLSQSIDSLISKTPNSLNIIVLRDVLKKITPKKIKKSIEGWKRIGKIFFVL